VFEHYTSPLIPRTQFFLRLLRSASVAASLIGLSLGLGIAGYHYTERLSFVDSLLNASMILGGMGPVDIPRTVTGKLFASFYALFSGVVFLSVAAVLFAPILHRLLHRLHLVEDQTPRLPRAGKHGTRS